LRTAQAAIGSRPTATKSTARRQPAARSSGHDNTTGTNTSVSLQSAAAPNVNAATRSRPSRCREVTNSSNPPVSTNVARHSVST